jgi:alpha-L-fucosidase
MGVVRRLVPGDQARVDVFITNTNTKGTATVIVRDPQGRVVLSSPEWEVQGLVETWTAEREVLERHETPVWVRSSPFLSHTFLSFLLPDCSNTNKSFAG